MPLRKTISAGILFAFLLNTLGPLPKAGAQDFRLPVPGTMVHLSPPLDPPILKGIKVYLDNPFRFDFVLDQGDEYLRHSANRSVILSEAKDLKEQSTKLIKYFLASLTIPEKDLWVNLSPYEQDRIIPQSFGLTEMGRDLLAEDYMLKQITASLIYPEGEVGKRFWQRIYQEAAKRFHTTHIPVNTFNKVWIVPEKAVVYENAKVQTAYVVEAKLKVMLEEDYLATNRHSDESQNLSLKGTVPSTGSQILREIVIPQLTREVNEGKSFAQLRQVYNSLILAAWYKKKIKDSILAQVYADRSKVAGIEYNKSVILSEAKDLKVHKDSFGPYSVAHQNDTEFIYHRYLQAFKKGVYNFIKEEQDPLTRETIPREYFSGGVDITHFSDMAMTVINKSSPLLKNILARASLATPLILSVGCSAVMPTIKDRAMIAHSPAQGALLQAQVFANEDQRAGFAGAGQVAQTIADAQTMAVPTLAGDIAFRFEDRSKLAEEYLKAEEIPGGYRYTLPSDLTVQEATELIDSIRRVPAGDQPLADVVAQSIIPWATEPPQGDLEQQMKSLTADPSSDVAEETSMAVARAVEGIKIELETLLYWRGVQIFSQELLAGKIDLKNLQEDIKRAESLGESEMSQVEEKTIRQIVDIIRQLPGWKNEEYMESSPQIGRLTREINCVLRSALAAFCLHNLGIRVWGLSMYKYQSLLAQLQNGQYLMVDPSNLKSVDVTKVDLPFSKSILEGRYFIYLENRKKDVLIYGWRKGIMASFYNSLGVALKAMGKLPEAIEAYDKVIGLNAKYAVAYNNKGVALEAMGKLPEAIESYDKAIRLNPNLAEARNNKERIWKKVGNDREEDEAFQKARELYSSQAKNKAMMAHSPTGGIDLTAANRQLQTRNSGSSIKFRFDPAQAAQLKNAAGFVPVIINIYPLVSLSKFLGVDG